ncbi:MAG: hypothetical protein ABR559_09895 [Gemmatimonadota bacterium]
MAFHPTPAQAPLVPPPPPPTPAELAARAAALARIHKAAAKSLAAHYARPRIRSERLDRLVEFLPGTADPLEGAGERDELIARETWEGFDTRHRNRAVGFQRRMFLVTRHLLHPPRYFSRTEKNGLFDKAHLRAVKLPKVLFRYKDIPMAALAPKCTLPVTPLLALVPRLQMTPTEDLAVILNSRFFHFIWQKEAPKASAPPVEVAARLAGFKVPMLTQKTGGPFRAARDKLLALAAENAERLVAMDQMQKIAIANKVELVPLRETEGIIRETNVPRAIGEVADVKRRGPVVIFRRGSTIVTTTEEAATYLELWLQHRFDQLRGMTKETLEEFITLPRTTADVVKVLQGRARIEAALDKTQTRIEELQREAESHLYDLYGFTQAERDFLRATCP